MKLKYCKDYDEIYIQDIKIRNQIYDKIITQIDDDTYWNIRIKIYGLTYLDLRNLYETK